MGTKIIVNGQEYDSVDAMPEDARKAYEQAMAQLPDANRDGIPDVMQGNTRGNVIGLQQSSITVNGQTYNSVAEMPAFVRLIYDQAMGQGDANRNGMPDALEKAIFGAQPIGLSQPEAGGPANLKKIIPILDGAERALTSLMRILLGAVAIAVLVGGILIAINMDEGSRSQGGVFYVVLGMLLILGAVIGKFVQLSRRR